MNKKSRKLLTWCLVLSMILTQVLFTNVALAATRHEGTDRYQTALAVVKAGWPTAETVVIAQGEELADALAAAPLAYAKGKAPILLTEPNKLPEGVLDELTALGTKTVYIVGGTGAVSSDVEAALAAKLGTANVIRLGGADRVETALKVANAAFPTAPTGVVLAGAYAYADALSASSIAAVKGMPILLVDGKLTDAEASYVAGKTVYAVGGTGVLPDAALPTGAKRLAGLDRYATNAAILGEFDLDYSKIYLAKGEDANMVDALAGSALAALTNSPIVLVDWNNTIASAKELLSAHITDDSEVIALGGSAVVPNSVIDAVEALKPSNNTTELKVESVTADNLKQIKVTFNKAVTDDDLKDEVEDKGNYKIENSKGDKVKDAIDTVNLDDSGKVATITLKDNDSKAYASPLENQEDYTLVINKSILNVETSIDFTAEDVELPKAEEANVVGINTVKVIFTEPMKPFSKDSNGSHLDKTGFEVLDADGDKIGIKRVDLVNDNFDANIVLYSDLKDGEELTVKVKSVAEDYAGYTPYAGTFDLTVVEDKEAPYVVGYKDASRSGVTLIFNEDIEKVKNLSNVFTTDDPFIYHTNKHNPATTATIDGKELKLTFVGKDPTKPDDDYYLPSGTSYIYINDGTVRDLWKNENDDLTAKVEITEDTTRPTVEKIEQDDNTDAGNTTFIVYYSEEVEPGTDDHGAENKDNYVVKDADGDKCRVSGVKLNDDGDEATVTMRDGLDAGDYTVEISDVEDLAGNKMENYKGTLTVEDKDAIDWSDVKVVVYAAGDKDDQRIIVDFGEKMTVGDDKYAIDDLDKYTLYVDSAKKSYRLSDWKDATIDAIGNDHKVEINLPVNGDTTIALADGDLGHIDKAYLEIARVADAQGNTTLALSHQCELLKTLVVNYDTKPEATDTDTIHFVYEGIVDFDEDDIEIKANTTSGVFETKYYTVNTDENKDGNTEVTITLDTDEYELAHDATFNGQAVKINVIGDKDNKNIPRSEDEDGNKITTEEAIVADAIAPAIAQNNDNDLVYAVTTKSYDSTTTPVTKGEATIVIKMTEDIDASTVSKSTFDLEDYDVKGIFVADDPSNLVPTTRRTTDGTLVGKYIVINVTGIDKAVGVDNGFGVYQRSAFEDAAGNEVTDLDTEVLDATGIPSNF